MAKWGEGDPRWIVEERPDAVNVNNWHWTEKNASHWSQEKLKGLLTGLTVDGEAGCCQITEVTSIEGDAVANNRKGKLIFFYEWVIKLNWSGRPANDEEEVTGKIEIPNLSEENEPKEVDVIVSVKTSGRASDALKEMMRTKGAEALRECFMQYIRELKEEFAHGMILPSKDGSGIDIGNVDKIPKTSKLSCPVVNGTATVKQEGVETSTVTAKETFMCTAEELYKALTVKEMVQAFTQGPCVLEAVKDGRFELFGGNVCGTFQELVPNKKVVQQWRFKDWPAGYYSQVVIDITQQEDCTEAVLTQTGVPKNDLERTQEGWKKFYWQSLKRTFGFGAMLF